MSHEREIFKRGSTTYYFSSIFFPPKIRQDVFKLYSFVRTADNYVDESPRQPRKLLDLEKDYLEAVREDGGSGLAKNGDALNRKILANILELQKKYEFNPEWVKAFLSAMKMDIDPKPSASLKVSLEYVYGSAEVIGMMMNNIVGSVSGSAATEAEVQKYARLQGRAMQWINFIRDIDEDNQLGRQYFPLEDISSCGLKDLSAASAKKHPEAFEKFIHRQISRYQTWQDEASIGHAYIPRRLRIPVKTAVDMYNWTAMKIAERPQLVFEKKLKPSRTRVMARAAWRSINA